MIYTLSFPYVIYVFAFDNICMFYVKQGGNNCLKECIEHAKQKPHKLIQYGCHTPRLLMKLLVSDEANQDQWEPGLHSYALQLLCESNQYTKN